MSPNIKCERCQSVNLIREPFLVVCKNCQCQSYYNYLTIESTKIFTETCHVRIDYKENKTYLNGHLIINELLPPDISEDKLKLYLTFS